MSLKQRAQQGFTLIELMIVVAIIGILAAVAIPQYKNYTVKAKLGNALSAVDSLKTAVALCIQENGGVKDSCDSPASGATGGPIPAFNATKEVSGVTVTDGTIVATLGSGIGTEADTKTITWTPNVGGTSVTWTITTTVQAPYDEVVTKNSVAASGT